MMAMCRQRLEEFGAAGWADKIKPVPLPEMAVRYASGELYPRFGSATKAAE